MDIDVDLSSCRLKISDDVNIFYLRMNQILFSPVDTPSYFAPYAICRRYVYCSRVSLTLAEGDGARTVNTLNPAD